MSAKVITFLNQKGGCGKTSSSINVAYNLFLKGKHALCIDFDWQSNLTSGFGCVHEEVGDYTIYTLLKSLVFKDLQYIKYSDTLHNKHGVDIIPNNLGMSNINVELSSTPFRDILLKKVITNGNIREDYDYIIIDSPPSLGMIAYNALNAADYLFIPSEASSFSLSGLDALLYTFESIKEMNPELQFGGLFFTRINPRTKLYKHYSEDLKAQLGENKVLSTFIRENEAVKQSQTLGEPVNKFDHTCAAAEDYSKLTDEILAIVE